MSKQENKESYSTAALPAVSDAWTDMYICVSVTRDSAGRMDTALAEAHILSSGC